jgi:hypothetical protein
MILVNIFKSFFFSQEPVKTPTPSLEPVPVPMTTKYIPIEIDSHEEESYTILGEKDSRTRKYKRNIKNKTRTVKKIK